VGGPVLVGGMGTTLNSTQQLDQDRQYKARSYPAYDCSRVCDIHNTVMRCIYNPHIVEYNSNQRCAVYYYFAEGLILILPSYGG